MSAPAGAYDPRVTPILGGVAARSLEGVIPADRYVDPVPMQVRAPLAGLRQGPEGGAELADQLLFGELYDVLESHEGWAWGQARRDGYVGWTPLEVLSPEIHVPTHRVSALRTYAFAEASLKTRPKGLYSLNALVTVEGEDGRYVKLAASGWVPREHLAPIGSAEEDPAAVAMRFLGAPYLWGGRDSVGLDCSGLVQQALYACGKACPRDTDQQKAALGRPIEPGAGLSGLQRTDLVFWRGHMGMMLDETRLLHANAHHMAVAIEPLAEAVARIEAAGVGAPTGFNRL